MKEYISKSVISRTLDNVKQKKVNSERAFSSYMPIIQRSLHVSATCCIESKGSIIKERATSQNDIGSRHWVLTAMNSIASEQPTGNPLYQCAEPKSLNKVLKEYSRQNPWGFTKKDVNTINWENIKYYYIENEPQDVGKARVTIQNEKRKNGQKATPCMTCATWIDKNNLKPLPRALQAVDTAVSPTENPGYDKGFNQIKISLKGRACDLIGKQRLVIAYFKGSYSLYDITNNLKKNGKSSSLEMEFKLPTKEKTNWSLYAIEKNLQYDII